MSKRRERLVNAQRRKLREQLVRHYREGATLTAITDAPGMDGLRRLVSVTEGPDGRSVVAVTDFDPSEWDTTRGESVYTLADLEDAFAWLEKQCGVPWWDLHGPKQ